jgi:hypothetical protein
MAASKIGYNFHYYRLGVTLVTCPYIWWAADPTLKCPPEAIRSGF